MKKQLMMSQKERTRLGVKQQVKARQLSLRAAAEGLGLGQRQVKRIWRRYRQQGDQGLVHRGRGRPCNRAQPQQLKARLLARYEQRYREAADFFLIEGLQENALAALQAGLVLLEKQAIPVSPKAHPTLIWIRKREAENRQRTILALPERISLLNQGKTGAGQPPTDGSPHR